MVNTWISETEKDIEELQITHLGTSYKILKVSKKNPRRKTGAVWTEERREKHKERIREIWRERKKEGSS